MLVSICCIACDIGDQTWWLVKDWSQCLCLIFAGVWVMFQVHKMCSLSITNPSRRGRLYPLGMVAVVCVWIHKASGHHLSLEETGDQKALEIKGRVDQWLKRTLWDVALLILRLIEAHFKLGPILNPSLRRGAKWATWWSCCSMTCVSQGHCKLIMEWSSRSGGKKKVTQQASVRCLESGLRYLLSAMVM